MRNKLVKIFRAMMIGWPAVLYFSYFPLIHLGDNDTMNFELSLPLIYLVVFDIIIAILLFNLKKNHIDFKKYWALALPLYFTLSILWSENVVRGVLTAGVMWAVVAAIAGVWRLRGVIDPRTRRRSVESIIWSGIAAGVWCALQCVMDLMGAPQEASLLCNGCVSGMFGFPHPNGMAIEPQFMGNLMLAPVIICFYMLVGWSDNVFSHPDLNFSARHTLASRQNHPAGEPVGCVRNIRAKNPNHFYDSKRHYLLIRLWIIVALFFCASILFLTFSRGAIYAFVIGVAVLATLMLIKYGKKCLRGIGMGVLTIVLAFIFTLNIQGLMAEVSPTNDTYASGVAKVLNHLTLGVVDIRGKTPENALEDTPKDADFPESSQALASGLEFAEEKKPDAVFDGYVEESTDTRLRLTDAALLIWRQDLASVMFGVGLGSAGQALYVHGLSPAPKEIVQNEYASLLLETGLVGLVLAFVVVMWGLQRLGLKNPALLGLVVAYLASLCFFSGLANALQIYLLPMMIFVAMLPDEVRTSREY